MIGYLFFALAIIVVDIITKQWALTACVHKLVFNKFIACQLAFNRGVSWSMLHTESTLGFVLVTLLVAAVIVFLCWYTYQRWLDYQSIFAEVIVLAGACANMIDRIWHGAVIDFIMLEYKGFVWPLFNIADTAIVLGVLLMCFGTLKKGK
jgi:signal peptidase II